MDEILESIRTLNAEDLRRTLRAWVSEDVGRGVNEWLSVVEAFTGRVLRDFPNVNPSGRAHLSATFTMLLEQAEVSGGIEEDQRVIRVLNVVSALVQKVGPSGEVMLLDPVWAAKVCLSQIRTSFDWASEESAHWRDLTRSEILQLRRVKNLVTPMVSLEEFLPEGGFRDQLHSWVKLLPALP
jgi:hypothetical protein